MSVLLKAAIASAIASYLLFAFVQWNLSWVHSSPAEVRLMFVFCFVILLLISSIIIQGDE